MAQRNIYTGRANKETVATASVNSKLYIVYASGQDVVIYTDTGCFVQSVSHPTIAVAITALASSSTGRLATASGTRISIFDPCPQKPRKPHDNDSNNLSDGGILWEHVSSFSLDGYEHCARAGMSCKWLSDDRVIVGIAQTLLVWTQKDENWELTWSQETSGSVDIIAPALDADVFASASYDCRMVKVWQAVDTDGYFRFRFQYVVHPDPVRYVFWKQPLREPFYSTDNLTLYTVTTSDQLYVWRSRATDDFGKLQNCRFGIRFVLAGTVDIASTDLSRLVDDVSFKRVVSVGVLQQIDSENQLADAHSLVEDTSASTSTSNSAKDSMRSDVSANGSSKSATKSSIDTRIIAREDSVYAVYDDGSLHMWDIEYRARLSTACRARRVLQTSGISNSTPFLLGADSSNALLASLLWQDTFGNRRLAAEDDLGHIYLFDVPKPSNSEVMRTPLHIHALWDGHKELVFHISVDPYSQRMATHSIEGELLIWDTLSTAVTEPETNGHIQQTLLLSRKMALDGSQIRTIAWAPTDSEFIAATDKQVYRLAFDSSTMQWVPSDFTLPQVKAYDRIFTYPSEISEATEKPGKQLPYFISSVRNSTRTIQTWKVPVNGKDIEYVGSFNLSHASHFDLASRVMPVPYPFFSLDNILATFNAESGKLRIWGIRTTPKFVWFCSKEHLLPCMNVKMIRYNSIDKAAIVSAEKDGSQVITIWVFSSTSRESHYLPAGTIHPRRKTDCVREIRWHLTDYAQTYLGIQWDDRIDVYCQERNLDDAWACILSIHASEYGADKSLGSFSFTASGEPIFSIEKQLVLCSEVVPNSTKRISDVAFDAHGELPMIHPFVLTELLSWGKMDIVKRLLSSLYDYMRQIEINGSTQSALPVVSLCELIADGTSSTRNSTRANKNMLSKYSGLFASDATSDDIFQIDGSEPDFGRFNTEKAEYLLEKLTEIKIKGISAIEQAHLSSIVGTISASLIKDQPLDEMGLRYMLKLHLLEIENKRQRSLSELPYRELNWALHSNSQAIMLQTCLQQHASSGLTWESARRMGLFMWLSDTNVLHSEVEKMARNMFIVENRDPTKCAIFYLALKKQRLLHGLWRIAHNHPERNKMLAFLSHDFSEARWKTAAAKNAYVLLSKQRYMDAATFFMLSDKLTDAATVCITQLKDIQLAITICRCYEGENGPVLKDITWKHVLPDAFKRQDRWLASLAFGILHKYDLVLQSLTDDLSQLATHIGISAQVSIYSPMNVLDTELLILYRSMLGHSPHYRAPLIVQAQLIASTITIFECLGVPVMALVVLEWWRKELFDITKRLELKAKPLHATPPTATPTAASIANSINTGTLDMSAFSGFGGFSSTSSSNGNPPAPSVPDPLASGMLSMDSFGSTFSEMFMGASKTSSGASGQDDALPNGVNLGLRSSSSSTSTTRNKANPSSDSTTNTLDDATLAMDIEDTPVQYACRVMLALQIADYIRRVCKSNGGGGSSSTSPAISLDQEKQAIADTLRLSLSVFPRDHE